MKTETTHPELIAGTFIGVPLTTDGQMIELILKAARSTVATGIGPNTADLGRSGRDVAIAIDALMMYGDERDAQMAAAVIEAYS